jgi:hypothetical protein
LITTSFRALLTSDSVKPRPRWNWMRRTVKYCSLQSWNNEVHFSVWTFPGTSMSDGMPPYGGSALKYRSKEAGHLRRCLITVLRQRQSRYQYVIWPQS